MTRLSPWLRSALALFTLLSLTPQAAEPSSRSRPNIILMVADDLGAHDLAVTGSRFFETPNLDRLAAQGLRFTQAYSAATICSPSRAALMTGKHPARLKLTDWIAGHSYPTAKLMPPPGWKKQLDLEETTLAEHLRPLGYTSAHLGKWHLGGTNHTPELQGFDFNAGGDHRGQPPSYFSPYRLPRLPDGPAGEYLTDREASEAVRFIAAHKAKPFFLNLCFHSVHTPLQAKAELIEKYRRKSLAAGSAQTNAVYAAMIESLDEAVGQILRALDDAGIAQQTLVVFTSDNGGLVAGSHPPTSNAPLRSGKGSPYEGGVRVPLIFRWPGIIPPGTVSAQPVISMDVPATILDYVDDPNSRRVGEAPPSNRFAAAIAAMDGVSLASVLRRPGTAVERNFLAWHYPHYHPGGATPYAAARSGDWKFIQYYETGAIELFNLREDPGETRNLAAEQTAQVDAIARRLFVWQNSVGAQRPLPNPQYVAPVVPPQSDGSIELHARSATVHGRFLHFEPQPFKNTLGWWTLPEDWVSWECKVERAGSYALEIMQGCGTDQGGSEVALEIAGQRRVFVVEETGHFQNFVPRQLGRIELPAPGQYTVHVKPVRKQAAAIMDLRSVRLTPDPSPRPVTDGAQTFRAAKRIVFLGDSITYAGEWIEFVETYVRLNDPSAQIDWLNLGLPSETVSGLSEPGHAGGAFPRPDLHERLDRILTLGQPNLIVACYGMNDGIYHPLSPERFQSFQTGIRRLRHRAAKAGVRLLHLTPPVFDPIPLAGRTLPAGLPEYRQPYTGYNEVLDHYAAWLLAQRQFGWDVVDIHTPMNQFLAERRRTNPQFVLAGDGVHANTQGHWLIARAVLQHLGAPSHITQADSPEILTRSTPFGADVLRRVQTKQRVLKDAWLTHTHHVRPGMKPGKPLPEAQMEADRVLAGWPAERTEPWPGKRSDWFGFDRFDFDLDGQSVLVVAPRFAAPGRPWVWHGEFFGHKPAPDRALLERGFHLVYLGVPDQLGSPEAVRHWNKLYQTLTTTYALAPKVALVGLSRGGLYCYNWAIANPDRVACIYADAPVCDFKSWPGGFGQGQRSERDWQLVLQRYGFASDAEARAYPGNPVDRLAPLAQAKVPLLHVFGDADEVVPWEENTGRIAERYRQLGGEINLIRKPGGKHHPHGLDDPTPIVEFIARHAAIP